MNPIASDDQKLIERIIDQCKECFLGMIDKEGLPYVIPMNFGYHTDAIYLHSSPHTSSVSYLTHNPNVCVTFCTDSRLTSQNEEIACSYSVRGSSVICRGKVSFIDDYQEKIEALDVMMAQYTDREFGYSESSVKNVKVWKVSIDEISVKSF